MLSTPQEVGFVIGAVIVGIGFGGVTVYRIIKKNFPVSDGSVISIKSALLALESRIEGTFNAKIASDFVMLKQDIEKTYLTNKSYEDNRELDSLRIREYMRETLDKIFSARDKRLEEHFAKIETMVDRNKEFVSEKIESFATSLTSLKEQSIAAHREIMNKIK